MYFASHGCECEPLHEKVVSVCVHMWLKNTCSKIHVDLIRIVAECEADLTVVVFIILQRCAHQVQGRTGSVVFVQGVVSSQL